MSTRAGRIVQGLSLRGLSYFSQLAVPVVLASSGVYGLRLWALVFVTWALSAAGVLFSSLICRRPLRWLPLAGVVAAALSYWLTGPAVVLALYVFAFISSYLSYFVITSAYSSESTGGIFGVMAGNAAGLMVGAGAAAAIIDVRPIASSVALALSVLALFGPSGVKGDQQGRGPGIRDVLRGISGLGDLFFLASVASLDWAVYTSYSAPAFQAFRAGGALTAALSAFAINAASFLIRLFMSGRASRLPRNAVQVASLPYAAGLFAAYLFLRVPLPVVLAALVVFISASHSLFPPLNLSEFLRRSTDRGTGFLAYNAATGLGEVISNVFAAFFVLGGLYGQLFIASSALTLIAFAFSTAMAPRQSYA